MVVKIQDIAEATLTKAIKMGADAADIIVAETEQASVDVLKGDLEMVQRSEKMTLGLRVILGHKQAMISSSDFTPETLDNTVARAITMARVAPDDPSVGLAEVNQLIGEIPPASLEQYDDTPFPSLEEMEQFGVTMEKAALDIEGVSNVSSASMQYGKSKSILMASNGFSGEQYYNYRGAGCSAIAGTDLGMQTDYYYQQRVFADDLDTPEFIGQKAGTRAAQKLNSQKPETMTCPVIYDRRVASSLIGQLLVACNGQSIARGSSWLMDSLDCQILPSSISLVEEPHRVKSLSSRYFDAEGLPTCERAIVDNGILKSWILDLGTARKLGLTSTGNANRSLTSGPSPSITNVSLTRGDNSKEDLIKNIQKGVFINSLIGSTINQNTGDYSRGASGMLIENGELTKPITEFTVAGNLKTILRSIIPANDPREFNSFRVPSVLVDAMTVAGN